VDSLCTDCVTLEQGSQPLRVVHGPNRPHGERSYCASFWIRLRASPPPCERLVAAGLFQPYARQAVQDQRQEPTLTLNWLSACTLALPLPATLTLIMPHRADQVPVAGGNARPLQGVLRRHSLASCSLALLCTGSRFRLGALDQQVDVAACGGLIDSRPEDDGARPPVSSPTISRMAWRSDSVSLMMRKSPVAPRVSLNGVLRLGRLNLWRIVYPYRSAPIEPDPDPDPTPPSRPLARPVAPGAGGA
jgi:hypothetical protein